MQVAINLPAKTIASLVESMDEKEFLQLKKAVQKRERQALKKVTFKKEPAEKIVSAFKQEGYSEPFLKDLEDGLKESGLGRS